jgi:small subunit ribosomal protein S18
MARNNDRDRGTKRAPREDRRRGGKKKVCVFCTERIPWVDYKEVNLLRRFMSDRGKIRARRVTGNCTQHQREVAVAIKTARELALLPYTQRTVTERTGPRGGGRGSGPRPGGPPGAPPSVPVPEVAAGEDSLVVADDGAGLEELEPVAGEPEGAGTEDEVVV